MTQCRNVKMNWIELFQRKKSKWLKTHEELFNIPGHKRSEIWNHVKIPLLPY
jgi:hypothetical protein